MVFKVPGFEALRLKYLNQLAARQVVISTHLKDLTGTDPKADLYNLTEAYGMLHQISGNAGSFGFGSLGDAARVCDGAIATLIENATALGAEDISALHKTLETFEAECAAAIASAE